MLTEAPGRKRISDIAIEAGFSDLSYFNRLFRSRFGDAPGGVRRRPEPAADDPAFVPRHCRPLIRNPCTPGRRPRVAPAERHAT
jgi:AraC-like DNA-binding protein